MATLRQEYRSVYWCWKAMKQRTRNPRCAAYHNYGGRGIEMTHEWDEFEPFLEWALENGWRKGLDIDRIDNDGPYCPDNCRWATRRENTNNRRMTIMLTVDGETRPLSEWADIIGADQGTIGSWVKKHGAGYAELRVSDALANGYKPRDYSYGHKKPVVHVDSGTEFKSIMDAANAYGVSPCTLGQAILHKGGVTKFGTFAYARGA